ncbi:MAG: hypothetical protein LAO78_06530 [Acidobacteriia bacterium]|nr:hypothetical protein [Terriglobia bacterium]
MVKTQCGDADCKACPASGVPANIEVIAGLAPRLPLAVLGRVTQIELSDPISGFSTTVNLCDRGKFILDPDEDGALAQRKKWDDVLRAFDKAPVEVFLVASPARRALPGDLIRTTIEWQFIAGDTTDTYSIGQLQSRVDEYGNALLPGLSSPSLADLHWNGPLQKSGLLREWVSDIDGSAFHIRMWRAEKAFGQQLSIQRIAACLSAIWNNADGTPDSLNHEMGRCTETGVEASYYQDYKNLGQSNHRVRYQLEVEQSWNLVCDGRVYQRTFKPGETIDEGVQSALRDIFAKEFHQKHSRHDQVFVVVIPRQELGQADSKPFWGRLDVAPATPLGSIFIAPGDVIQITSHRPRPWR